MSKKEVEKYLYEIKQKKITTQLFYSLLISSIEKNMDKLIQFNDQQLDEIMGNLKSNIHTNVNRMLKITMRTKYGSSSAKQAIIKGYYT